MNKDRLQMYISVTRIAIVLCWLSLFSFWALKIFGGNFFEIMVENENFIRFCQYAENSWIRHLINFVTISIVNIFMYGAVRQKFFFNRFELLAFIVITISIWAIRFAPNFLFIHLWFSYSIIIIYGIITNKGKAKFNGIICCALDFLFSTISMLVRNIPIKICDNFIVGNILLIDMYIMYSLYYLYSNLSRIKKEL